MKCKQIMNILGLLFGQEQKMLHSYTYKCSNILNMNIKAISERIYITAFIYYFGII